VKGGEIYLYKGRKEGRKESVGFKINLIKFELVSRLGWDFLRFNFLAS